MATKDTYILIKTLSLDEDLYEYILNNSVLSKWLKLGLDYRNRRCIYFETNCYTYYPERDFLPTTFLSSLCYVNTLYDYIKYLHLFTDYNGKNLITDKKETGLEVSDYLIEQNSDIPLINSLLKRNDNVQLNDDVEAFYLPSNTKDKKEYERIKKEAEVMIYDLIRPCVRKFVKYRKM